MTWYDWLIGIAEFVSTWWLVDQMLMQRHTRKPVQLVLPPATNTPIILPKGVEHTALPTGTASTSVYAWGGDPIRVEGDGRDRTH
jgi:hypothetical protein